MTTPEQFAGMTEAQKYAALSRAELDRDNALYMLRERSGKAAEARQDAIVEDLRGIQTVAA